MDKSTEDEKNPSTENMPEPAVKGTGLEPHIAAALSYFLGFITGVFILLTEKKDRFVRFHAWQSIVFSVAFLIVSWFIRYIPYVGWLLSSLWGLLTFVIWLLLMYKALNKEYYKLPYIGDFAEKNIDKIK